MRRKCCTAWMIITIILTLCLAGCHRTRVRDIGNGTETTTSSMPKVQEESKQEQEELVVFYQGCDSLLMKLDGTYGNLKLKIVPIEDQSIEEMSAWHGAPDLLFLPGDANVEDLIERDIIAPLDEYYYNDITIDHDLYFPGVLSVGKIGENMYAVPLQLNMSYMTIRESQWEQSELSKLPEEYNFEELLTAMEMEFNIVQEEGFLRFYEEISEPLEMMLDGGIVSWKGSEIELDMETLEHMIRVLCRQEYNKGTDVDKTKMHLGIVHPALNPVAFEGKYLASCWGGDVKSAPQVGVMYAHSANMMQFGEETHVVWRPNNEKGEFSASVQAMAMIGKGADHQKEAYEVIRYLMDVKTGHWQVPAKTPFSIETFCPINRERAKELITLVDEDARENLECMSDGGELAGVLLIPKEPLTEDQKAEMEYYLDRIANVYRADPAIYAGVEEIIMKYMNDAYRGIVLEDYSVCCEEIKAKIEENLQ